MNILVTGYKGFIGSNMVEYLRDQHEVTTFEWGDDLPVIRGINWVIHMGAISTTTETDVQKIARQNIDFSIWLLHECIKHGANLQFSSSASVYGMLKEFKESSNVDPRTPYAWSKYAVERIISNTPHDNIIQCFRYFNVYGKNEDHKTQPSPYHQFKKQYQQTGKIKLFENSHLYLRDFIPVEQVVKTHVDFFKVRESGIWNLGTGKPQSFLDVALSIAQDQDLEYIPMPEKLKNSYQEYTCADTTKLENTLAKII